MISNVIFLSHQELYFILLMYCLNRPWSMKKYLQIRYSCFFFFCFVLNNIYYKQYLVSFRDGRKQCNLAKKKYSSSWYNVCCLDNIPRYLLQFPGTTTYCIFIELVLIFDNIFKILNYCSTRDYQSCLNTSPHYCNAACTYIPSKFKILQLFQIFWFFFFYCSLDTSNWS